MDIGFDDSHVSGHWKQLQEKVGFSGSEGVRWDKVGNKPADDCTFFSGMKIS